MCMEPMLRNIESNPAISPMASTTMNANLPQTYAYADDVSGTIKDCESSLKEFFKEYERLTKMSGLELNADKTELIKNVNKGFVNMPNSQIASKSCLDFLSKCLRHDQSQRISVDHALNHPFMNSSSP